MLAKYKDLIWSLAIALLAAFLLRAFVFSVYKIPTSSMQPNLLAGDFVMAYKLPYGFRFNSFMTKKMGRWQKPQRGEVFVFRLPTNPNVKYIKRVVAVSGDQVEIKEDQLIINDQVAKYTDKGSYKNSPYLTVKLESLKTMEQEVLYMDKDQADNYGPFVVPSDSVFVLGDNRDSSDDSRYWGVVSLDDIESKVFGIWFSLDVKSNKEESGFQRIRWKRIMKGID